MGRDRHFLIATLALGGLLALQQGASGSILSFAAGAAGLFAIHERLRRTFNPTAALITAILIFGGTSLFWSMTREPSATDSVAFAIAAVALALADREPFRPLMAMGGAAVAVAAALAARALSAAVPADPAARMWTTGMDVLFSSSRGLLALTPVVYLALLGLLVCARRNRRVAMLALTTFLAMVFGIVLLPSVASTAPSGHGLTGALAVVAPGLAFLVERVRARPWLAVAPMIAVAVVWNYWLMVQYTIGTLPKDEPVSFAGMVRQQMAVHTRSPYVYPFALPANVWFAWREGVPVERFESLAFEPRRSVVDLAMDRRSERFILDGWEGGAEGSGPQWIREPRAAVTVPFDPPSGGGLDVVVTARARLEEPAVAATIGLEVNGQEIGRFVVPPTAPVNIAVRVPADAVGRIWRAGYNRLTFVSYGIERVDPSDTRPPGPLGSRSKDRPWPVAIYRVRITPSS